MSAHADLAATAAIRARPSPTAAAPPPRLDACLEGTAALHRYLCPRHVLGVRMGLYAGELLDAGPVTLTVDLDAMRSRPGRRVVCAECGEDVHNEREVIRGARTLCRACAGDSYFGPAE